MQNKPLMFAVLVIAIVAVGLLAMPALSEHVYAGNFVSESKNQSKQVDLTSDTKREGLGDHNHTGFPCPYRVIHCYGSGSNDHPFSYSPT